MSASARLLIARKLGEPEHLMNSVARPQRRQPAVDKGACRCSARGETRRECDPAAVVRAAYRSRIRALQKWVTRNAIPSTSAMLTMMMKIKNRPILILPCVERCLSGSLVGLSL